MLNAAVTFGCHLLWFASCLPSWFAFQFALRHPRKAQERLLRRLLRRNRETGFGRAHGFAGLHSGVGYAARVPLAEYEAFAPAIAAARDGGAFGLAAERPVLLEPTSGSSGRAKLIPITPALRREFAAAVKPWIAWLYLAHPRLLLGRQYWSVSPNTPVRQEGGRPPAVPTGFADDTDYAGPVGRWISARVLANPPELRRITDPATFSLVTLVFLLRERNLRLISVWHPSFLTLLLAAIPRHCPAILQTLRRGCLPESCVLPTGVRRSIERRLRADQARADEISALGLGMDLAGIGRVWPRLTVISCWEGSRSEPWLGELRRMFPHAHVQGKGLLATEACVSLPTGCGRSRPCAVRSHYLEFIPRNSGKAVPVWALEQGGEYSVIVTTGGGLWRYRLHDEVRVTGFCHATPCLEFLGKDNLVSDLVGEKLAEPHAAEALDAAAAVSGVRPGFAMLVPDSRPGGESPCGYRLLLEFAGTGDDPQIARQFAEVVERELNRNYHYAHARRLGQLRAVEPVQIRDGFAAYQAAREASGTRQGMVKVPALEVDRGVGRKWWADVGVVHASD